MSSQSICSGDAFIQELIGVGLSSDQIFQLLMKKEELLIEKEKTNRQELDIGLTFSQLSMEREKTYQKQELNRLSPDQMFQLLMKREECKLLEFEHQEQERYKTLEFEANPKNKRKHDDHSSSPSFECGKQSKKVCNEFPNRKSLQDLCTDELVTIFDFIPDFGAFKLARVSKQFHQIVLNNIKKVHLITTVKKDNTIEEFLNSGCFQNVESLIIDFDIQLNLVRAILKNSDNLRELGVVAFSDSNECIRFSEYPRSSFKKLESLHLILGDECRVKSDHVNLCNLTDFTIEDPKCDVSDYLNERTNNIKELDLISASINNLFPKMKALTHVTIEKCSFTKSGFSSLFVDTLEYLRILTCNTIHESSKYKSESTSKFPNLKIVSIIDAGGFDFTTLFKSPIPNLTFLQLNNLTKLYAKVLSENNTITSLKKLVINSIEERGALEILMKSKTLFKEIELIDLNVPKLDSNILLYMCKNGSMFSNLKTVALLFEESGLNGYQTFFSSEHFGNLEKLTITTPSCVEDLNYLAQTTCFPNLKILHVIGGATNERPPTSFFSLFSNNTNFSQLRELALWFLDDSSIPHLKSMKNLKTVYARKCKVTGWGLKQLEELGLRWLLLDDRYTGCN